MKYKNKANKRSKKNKAITSLVILAILASGGFYLIKRDSGIPRNISPQSVAPTTEQEKTETEQNKAKLAKQQDKKDNPPSSENITTDTNSTVTITSATAESVYAFVSGVLEDGGTCTATFTKNEQSFQKASKGFINVNTTQCEPTFLSRTDFPSVGIWQVVVSYNSGTAQGVSRITTINVK